MAFIYKITNTQNNKMYIGQTKQKVKKRRYKHKWALRKGNHANAHLQSAWNKYGEESFDFKVIVSGLETREECNTWEAIFIKLYKTLNREYGYNKSSNPYLKIKCSKERSRNMSKAKKAYYQTPEGKAACKKHSELMTGRRTSSDWELEDEIKEFWLDKSNGIGRDAHPGHTILCKTFNISTGVAKMMIAQWEKDRIKITSLDTKAIYNYWLDQSNWLPPAYKPPGKRVLSKKFNISEDKALKLITDFVAKGKPVYKNPLLDQAKEYYIKTKCGERILSTHLNITRGHARTLLNKVKNHGS